MVGSEHLREFWTCPTCQLKLPMTVSERIRHQAACGQDDVIKSEVNEFALLKYAESSEMFTIFRKRMVKMKKRIRKKWEHVCTIVKCVKKR